MASPIEPLTSQWKSNYTYYKGISETIKYAFVR